MSLRCFLLEPTENVRRWLRRYTQNHTGGWTCAEGWHEAMVPLGDAPAVFEDRVHGDHKRRVCRDGGDRIPDDDPRWPTKCEKCDFHFAPEEIRQVFYDLIYKRQDTGELVTLRDAPPGAMWNAWWLADFSVYRGPDGMSLMAKCPNGRDWAIDGRASNCTMPQDDVHKCWVRHGTPPNITVDKAGVTCAAGAGSIQAGDYHGFLRNGEFT